MKSSACIRTGILGDRNVISSRGSSWGSSRGSIRGSTTSWNWNWRFLLVVLEDLPLSRSQGNSSATVSIRFGVGCWGDSGKTVVLEDDNP